MVKAYITIKESVPQINKLIKNALIEEINKKFNLNTVRELVNSIKDDIKLILLKTPEANSLLGGELSKQFGIPSGLDDNFVKTIISTIAENIEFKFNKMSSSGNTINGGFTFYVAKSNFSDILALPQANITTEKGQTLPWLKWLLFDGDRIIISKHSLIFVPQASRSHSYIMINNNGGFWKVPAEFSGTVKNNWITRALDEKTNNISKIIAAKLEKVF